MKYCFILLFVLLSARSSFSQEVVKLLTKRIIVKSNVLSLIAKRPTITIEKLLSKNFSAEASFVQGEFNHFLFTDHYSYNGFLIRAKKYFILLLTDQEVWVVEDMSKFTSLTNI